MLPKAYDPQGTEDRIYQMWEQSRAFEAKSDSKKPPFTISMPPPNATGQLHLGHAVMLALEDIFIRFQRMRGKEALWIPGTDHAAIATESVVIRQIQKEERIPDPRATLGREELLKRIAEYVERSRGTIRSQVRKMGASCDWSRERYTMDPMLNRCVNEVFVKMYEDGLIYRGHRIVNWDPKLQTTISDDEIVYREEKTPYYTFQYGPFQISTARPETKFGDKYVVMHPDDERYKQYKNGDTFTAEWILGPVQATVIKDKDAIDPSFGTGVMTITPWHAHVDFDLAERHGLAKEQVIGFDGKLLSIAGEFAGLPIEEARPKVVEKLKAKGLLVNVEENYIHRLPVSQRGGGVVEPQIKEQWFVDVNKKVVHFGSQGKGKKQLKSLKEIMQEVVRSKTIAIIPERYGKVYFNWIDNLRDWCISRQIWWGHRIPVYYCVGQQNASKARRSDERLAMSDELTAQSSPLKAGRHSSMIVSVTPISQCPVCGGRVDQDTDTLDTWFSSGLWTWSTLMDPRLADRYDLSLPELLKQSPDYRKFHPTDVLETAADILFFWVARMILMTTYVTGDIPFKTVYLHGLILDREGRKMSKSHPETAIDPLDIIPKYGADALRLSMIVGQSPGNDARLYEEKIAGYRNFINKLWNASRFVLMQCENSAYASQKDPKKIDLSRFNKSLPERLSLADEFILSELNDVIRDVTKGLEEYRLSEVGERLYSFVWNDFCDWYLESQKVYGNDCAVLVFVLKTVLKLLHPYCPFVTEELWQYFASAEEEKKLLLQQDWPEVSPFDVWLKKEKAAEKFRTIIDVVSSLRKIRFEYNKKSSDKLSATLVSTDLEILKGEQANIQHMAGLENLILQKGKYEGKEAASVFTKTVAVHVPLSELILDSGKEKERLQKEIARLTQLIEVFERKLSDQNFITRAPAKVVDGEREKIKDMREKISKMEERLTLL